MNPAECLKNLKNAAFEVFEEFEERCIHAGEEFEERSIVDMAERVFAIFMKEQAHQSVSQPPENSDGRIIPQFMRLGALSCCSRSLRGESRICGEWWFRHRVHELNFGPLCVRCMHPVVGLLFWQNGPCHYGHLDRATPWLQKKRWQGSFDDWTGLVSPAIAGQHTDSC